MAADTFLETEYSGESKNAFWLSNSGTIFIGGVENSYIDSNFLCGKVKWMGILTDMYYGQISLVVNGVVYPPAFGKDAAALDLEEQTRQVKIITKSAQKSRTYES